MKLTQHSSYKLKLFGIDVDTVIKIISNLYMRCHDTVSGALIVIGFIDAKLYCLVLKEETIITL